MTSTGHIDLDWSHIWPVTHFREKEFWCVQQSCSPYRKMAKEMEFNMSAAVVLNLVPLSFWSHHNCQAGDQLPHIKFHANQTTDCRFRCKSDLSKLVKLVNIQTAELRRFPFFQISNMATIRIVIEVIFQNLVIFRTQFSICTQSLMKKNLFLVEIWSKWYQIWLPLPSWIYFRFLDVWLLRRHNQILYK